MYGKKQKQKQKKGFANVNPCTTALVECICNPHEDRPEPKILIQGGNPPAMDGLRADAATFSFASDRMKASYLKQFHNRCCGRRCRKEPNCIATRVPAA
jgi:hypothetical protein